MAISWKEVKIGSRIAVYWNEYRCYYACKVVDKKNKNRKGKGQSSRVFMLEYEDCSRHWTDLAMVRFRWQDYCIDEDEENTEEKTILDHGCGVDEEDGKKNQEEECRDDEDESEGRSCGEESQDVSCIGEDPLQLIDDEALEDSRGENKDEEDHSPNASVVEKEANKNNKRTAEAGANPRAAKRTKSKDTATTTEVKDEVGEDTDEEDNGSEATPALESEDNEEKSDDCGGTLESSDEATLQSAKESESCKKRKGSPGSKQDIEEASDGSCGDNNGVDVNRISDNDGSNANGNGDDDNINSGNSKGDDGVDKQDDDGSNADEASQQGKKKGDKPTTKTPLAKKAKKQTKAGPKCKKTAPPSPATDPNERPTAKDIRKAHERKELSKEDALLSLMLAHHMLGTKEVFFEKLVSGLGYRPKNTALETAWRVVRENGHVEDVGSSGKKSKKKKFRLSREGIDLVAPESYKHELDNPAKTTEDLHKRILFNAVNEYGRKIFGFLLECRPSKPSKPSKSKPLSLSQEELSKSCGINKNAHSFFYALKQLRDQGYVIRDPKEKKAMMFMLSDACFLD